MLSNFVQNWFQSSQISVFRCFQVKTTSISIFQFQLKTFLKKCCINVSFSVESRISGLINNSTKFIGCENDKVKLSTVIPDF